MKDIKCNKCAHFCGLIYLPTAAMIPMYAPDPVMGTIPNSEDVIDIRDFCKENYLNNET